MGLCTNGRLLAYFSHCMGLIKSGINKFIISHGPATSIHDSLTRTPGSFAQTVQGLRNLSNLKKVYSIELNTSTAITKINCKYLKNILKFLFQFDLDKIIMNVAQSRGEHWKRFFHLLMLRYIEVIREFKSAYHQLTSFFKRKKLEITLLGILPCVAGEKTL